jgi:hypothetical protein
MARAEAERAEAERAEAEAEGEQDTPTRTSTSRGGGGGGGGGGGDGGGGGGEGSVGDDMCKHGGVGVDHLDQVWDYDAVPARKVDVVSMDLVGLDVEDVAATVDEWYERLRGGGMLLGLECVCC